MLGNCLSDDRLECIWVDEAWKTMVMVMEQGQTRIEELNSNFTQQSTCQMARRQVPHIAHGLLAMVGRLRMAPTALVNISEIRDQ